MPSTIQKEPNQGDKLILLIHHEVKWDRISQHLAHFFPLVLLSLLPAVMNTNVFQSGSYFLTTHSGAFKFRLPHHCHIPKTVCAAACEGTLLSLAHGGKLRGAKKLLMIFSWKTFLKTGLMKLTLKQNVSGHACIFNFLFL